MSKDPTMVIDGKLVSRPSSRGRTRPVVESLEPRQLLATIVVNSAGDADGSDGSDTLSLRQAIEISDGTLAVSSLTPAQASLVTGALSAPNSIDFDIPGTGPITIRPLADLPAIVVPAVIDGYSEPGARPNTNGPGLPDNAALRIALSGSEGLAGGTLVHGLVLAGPGSTVQGLAIGGFGDFAIEVSGAVPGGGLIQGNFIGTDVTGLQRLGIAGPGIFIVPDVTGDTIGGTTPAARNVIAGSTIGVEILNQDDLVEGNFIGTDANGTTAIPNAIAGIFLSGIGDTIGGTTPGAGNVLSGNVGIRDKTGYGLEIRGSQNVVEGNLVGTDLTGTVALPNAGDGIVVQASSINKIGGTAAGAGNVIAFNGGSGVGIAGGDIPPIGASTPSGVTVSGNSIFDNDGLGIDLGDDGVTPNNPAGSRTGPNHLQPYPVLTSATPDEGGTSISGTLDAGAGGRYTLEFFANIAPDPSGFGQGRTYLGSAVVSTDASGHASFTFRTDLGLLGQYVTATATDRLFYNDTSEFSRDLPVLLESTMTQILGAPPTSTTTVAPITLEGMVTPTSGGPVATGTVTLLDNGLPMPAALSTAPLDATGHFTFNLAPLAAGSHVFTLAYSGTTDLAPSTSRPIMLAVSQVATTTTLATSPASPVSGQPLTLVATVEGTGGVAATGGMVTFTDRSRVLGSAAVDASGRASIVIPASDGFDIFAAVYDGSPAYTQSVSALSPVTAARVTPGVVLVGPSNISTFGQTLPFVAIVVPSGGVTPTGSVAFGEKGVVLAVVPLDASGRATFISSGLAPGPHVLSAAYLGDGSDHPALSNFVSQGVLMPASFGGPTVTSTAALTPTTEKVTFSRPLLVGPAQDTNNYTIVGPAGRDLPIASAAYDPADDSVTLTTGQPLKAGASYRITVNGLRSGRVVDVNGIPLAGRSNGRPGSMFAGTIKLRGNGVGASALVHTAQTREKGR